MAALVFVIIAVMLGASTYGQTMSVPAALLRGIPLGLGGAALFLVINTVMLMTRINRAYKEKRAQEFTQDVTIGREGVRASSTRGAALLKWGNIVRVRESGKTFYLFLSKTQAYILPKISDEGRRRRGGASARAVPKAPRRGDTQAQKQMSSADAEPGIKRAGPPIRAARPRAAFARSLSPRRQRGGRRNRPRRRRSPSRSHTRARWCPTRC